MLTQFVPMDATGMPCLPQDILVRPFYPSFPMSDLQKLEAEEAAANLIRACQQAGEWCGVPLSMMKQLLFSSGILAQGVLQIGLDILAENKLILRESHGDSQVVFPTPALLHELRRFRVQPDV